MAEPNPLNHKQETPFIDNSKVAKLIHKVINLSREMNCPMVKLTQTCKSIQVAATVEINESLAQMVDAEIAPPPSSGKSEKQKHSKQRAKTKKRQAENCTNNHDH